MLTPMITSRNITTKTPEKTKAAVEAPRGARRSDTSPDTKAAAATTPLTEPSTQLTLNGTKALNTNSIQASNAPANDHRPKRLAFTTGFDSISVAIPA